jgi:hypothetical protein
MTPVRLRHATAIGVLIISAGILVVAAWVPVTAAAWVLAIPIAMLAPGFGLSRLLDIRAGQLVTSLGLALVLSLSIDTLMVVAVTGLGVHLSARTGSAYLAGILLVLAGALAIRNPRRRAPSPSWTGHQIVRTAAPYVWIGIVGVAVVALYHALPAAPAQPFVAFSVAGPTGNLTRTTSVTSDSAVAVPLAVRNSTGTAQAFTITGVTSSGHEWHPIELTLPSGSTWSGVMRGDPGATGCDARVSFTLRSRGSTSPATSQTVQAPLPGNATCTGRSSAGQK